jgi:hypothetical protein|tara:strand:+ start:230 stop:484 length:255 start_codon:yes stop_codon:yes gene_type:complete
VRFFDFASLDLILPIPVNNEAFGFEESVNVNVLFKKDHASLGADIRACRNFGPRIEEFLKRDRKPSVSGVRVKSVFIHSKLSFV